MVDIDKSFGRQRVLEGVTLDVRAGEVHVLAGENGAGKSTLIRVLGGVHAPDGGRIRLGGRDVRFHHPREAAAHGIAIIHQELSLVPSMSIVDNMFLGRERSKAGWLLRRGARAHARDMLLRLGLDLDVRRPAGELSISAQQVVEIAKALAMDASIIVMDEPTSALNELEAKRLFARVRELKARERGIIYITHRLDEIYALADRITVLRDGRKIVTSTASDLPVSEMIRCMIGRTLSDFVPRRRRALREVRLRVNACTVRALPRGRPPLVDAVSFDVRGGEVLGLVGLQGSGVSDLLWAIFGALGNRATASIEVDGDAVRISSTRHAIRNGLALVTNDRKRSGLIGGMSVVENATLAALPRLTPGAWLSRRRELDHATATTRSMNLRAASPRQSVDTLSGGNQQKVVLAKWASIQPRVFLLDEPTRGVDVGAKREIFLLMNEWTARGCAVVLATSELPELLRMSDRIMVMRSGRVVAMFDAERTTQEELLRSAMGETANG